MLIGTHRIAGYCILTDWTNDRCSIDMFPYNTARPAMRTGWNMRRETARAMEWHNMARPIRTQNDGWRCSRLWIWCLCVQNSYISEWMFTFAVSSPHWSCNIPSASSQCEQHINSTRNNTQTDTQYQAKSHRKECAHTAQHTTGRVDLLDRQQRPELWPHVRRIISQRSRTVSRYINTTITVH